MVGHHEAAAEGAHCVRKKGGAGGIVGEAAAGRTEVAGTLEEHSSDGSSEQTAGQLEEAALGRAEEGRCEAGHAEDRVEDAAHPATADLGNRLGGRERLLAGLELEDLCMDPDSEDCSQLEVPEEVHCSLLGVDKEQTRGDCLLCLHARHHLEEALGAEGIRTADSAGRNWEEGGP